MLHSVLDIFTKGLHDIYKGWIYGVTSPAWDSWSDFERAWESDSFKSILYQQRVLPTFVATVALAYAIYVVVEGDEAKQAPREPEFGGAP